MTAEEATMHDDTPTSGDTGGDTAVVPELVGLPASEAHDRALDAGVLAVGRNAVHTGAGRGHVADQEPPPGEERERGSEVGIWIAGGGAPPPPRPHPPDRPPGGGGGGGGPPPPGPRGAPG